MQSNDLNYKEIKDTIDISQFRNKLEQLIPDYLKKEQEIAIKTSEQSKVMTLG